MSLIFSSVYVRQISDKEKISIINDVNGISVYVEQVEQELTECKRDYRTESLNFAFALNDMQSKKHYSVLMNSISWCFAQCEYYKDAWDLSDGLQTYMKDLKVYLRTVSGEL